MTPRQRKPIDTSTYEGRFALRLKALREKTGMSVDELAETSGIPRTTLYNWESGINQPLVGQLPKLAEAVNVSVRTLLPKE
jgi:transcriptional regulator with XRE-family HTH domain